MIGKGDGTFVDLIEGLNLPNRSRSSSDRNFQHLVKIAIIDLSVPTDGNQIAAHDIFSGAHIKIIYQKCHVFFVFIFSEQLIQKSFDRHVGNCEEMVKLDSEEFVQFFFVIEFEILL